ncbi:aldehyde dehydrogenase, partial [Streptomyces anulatus]
METQLRRPGPVPRGEHFTVVDPATGEAFDEAPDQQAKELDAVVGRAHEAWPG